MITNAIVTKRLILRTMEQDDAAAVWAMWCDRETGKYLCDPYYESPEELRKLFSDIAVWTDYPFVAVDQKFKNVIGTCGIGPEGKSGEWGVGYCLRRDQWNKGFATEMVKAAIGFAYRMGIRDFTAECAEENHASERVLQKCGMYLAGKSSFEKQGTGIIYPSFIYKRHLD